MANSNPLDRDRDWLQSFLDLERELDLLDRKIGGISLWERLRVPVYQRILRKVGAVGEAHVHMPYEFRSYLKGAWMLVRNLAYRNALLSDPSELLLLGSPRRRLLDDGLWWDIYCDPIISSMPWSFTYLEAPYANGHYRLVPTRNRRYLDTIRYWAFIQRKLRPETAHLAHGEKSLLTEVERKIAMSFGVFVDVRDLAVRTIILRRVALPAYERIVSRVKPKLAFLVCSYGNETFIESCKNVGVPTVELQHGIISPDHLGYSYPEHHSIKTTFPDHLFLFGDFWREDVRFPIPQERVHSVGYPFLETQVGKYSKSEKKFQMIFVSEGTIGAQLSRIACDVARTRGRGLPLVYKLHPGECAGWRRRYPWLAQSGIRVVDTDYPSLHQLLSESQFQVGVCSTALYEGLAFGLQTILIDLPGVGHMRRLVDVGDATIASSAKELLGMVSAAPIVTDRPGDLYFRQNSLESILNVSKRLMGGLLS